VQVIFTHIATQTRDARDVGRQHRLVGLPVPRDSREASSLDAVPVGNACAAVTPALHQAAITNLKDAFCNCRSTQDVVAEFTNRSPG
jgi:hypothetical protein